MQQGQGHTRRVPPQLRLSSLVNINTAVPTDDAESPVDVRTLATSGASHGAPTGAGNLQRSASPPGTSPLELPSNPSLVLPNTQNEIKKAQNRKSAKRFREAQKRRWQLLNSELEHQKRLVEELRSASRMSITSLTSGSGLVDVEASLYAQLLCSPSPDGRGAYVGELGGLHRCILISRSGIIKGVRRGMGELGTNLFKEMSPLDEPNVRSTLVGAVDIVAIGYVRCSRRFNAIVKPVPNTEDVLLAEFLPFNNSNGSNPNPAIANSNGSPATVQTQQQHRQAQHSSLFSHTTNRSAPPQAVVPASMTQSGHHIPRTITNSSPPSLHVLQPNIKPNGL